MAERPKLTIQDAPPSSFNNGRSDGAAPCHQDVASEQELIPADGPQEISDNVFLCQQNEVLQARVMELEALLQEASSRQLWAAELAERALTPVMANDTRHNSDSMAELQVLRQLSEDSHLHSDFHGQQILATPNQMHNPTGHSAITHDVETSALALQDIETCASIDEIPRPSDDAVDLSQRKSLERLQIDMESLRMQLEEAVAERDTLSLRLDAEVAKCNGLYQHLQRVPQLESINEDLSQQLADLNEQACELAREGEALRLERDDLLRQLSTAEAARMEWLSAAEAARMEMASAGERFQEQYEALQLEIMQPLSSETALHVDEGQAPDSRPLPVADPQVPYVFQGGMADANTGLIGLDQEDKHLQSDLNAALAEADSLRADHRTLHAAHCSLQAAHDNLQHELHDALTTVGTLRALIDELKQQLLASHAVAESECEGRTAVEALENSRISQAAESCRQEAEAKVKESEAQLAETLLAFNQLLTVHMDLEKSHEDLKSIHHELESDHAQACEDMANLRDDHTRMLIAISDLRSKHAELEASHRALLAEHAKLEAKHSNLEAEKSTTPLSEVAVATENQGAALSSAGAHQGSPDIGMRAPDVVSQIYGRDMGDQIMAASSRPFHSRALVQISTHIGTAIAEQLLALEEASQHMQGVDWCGLEVYCLQVMNASIIFSYDDICVTFLLQCRPRESINYFIYIQTIFFLCL